MLVKTSLTPRHLAAMASVKDYDKRRGSHLMPSTCIVDILAHRGWDYKPHIALAGRLWAPLNTKYVFTGKIGGMFLNQAWPSLKLPPQASAFRGPTLLIRRSGRHCACLLACFGSVAFPQLAPYLA